MIQYLNFRISNMKQFKIYLTIFTACFFLSGSYSATAQNQNNFKIAKSLDIYSNIIKELNLNYVDQIYPEKMMKVGIDAMLKELDPYTVFIPETEIEDYQIITTGTYGGIGVLIHQDDGKTIVSEIYKGFPAEIAGMKVGDQVIEIDDINILSKTSTEVSKLIKGPAKSSVIISVKRYGESELLDLKVNREIIKIENIPYYGLLENDIAYIKLVGFSNNASKEVKRALQDLETKTTLKGLILDLRGNGGGLMNEAIDIVNLFVDKNQEVVSTKGKITEQNMIYKTRFESLNKEIPLAVMINHGSASASEIVAGALQDLDRAVIIGQRSFGKGLVQNVLPLSYNTMAKITIAKYYIPSGRCIQAIDYSLKDENGHFTKIPDSLITEYKTKSGRKVYDGGGIDPDIKLKPNIYSQLTTNLFGRFFIFDFATKYANENANIADPKHFKLTDQIYQEFQDYLKERDYSYKTIEERTLALFKKQAEKDECFASLKPEYEALKAAIDHNKLADFTTYQDEIKRILKLELVSRYYFIAGKVESSLTNDTELEKAMEVILDQPEYHTLLNPVSEKILVKK
jgi:carboxyl-terminal processing protease